MFPAGSLPRNPSTFTLLAFVAFMGQWEQDNKDAHKHSRELVEKQMLTIFFSYQGKHNE